MYTITTTTAEAQIHAEIIDGIVSATSATDLNQLLVRISSVEWIDQNRYVFLIGLLEGALLQFNREKTVSIINKFFKQ